MEAALSISTWSGARKTLVLFLLVLILLPFLYVSLPHGLDWHDTYRPAALAVLLALVALYHDDLGYLSEVPVLHLALAVIGVPLAATAAGWLLAGREPPAIARPAIE